MYSDGNGNFSKQCGLNLLFSHIFQAYQIAGTSRAIRKCRQVAPQSFGIHKPCTLYPILSCLYGTCSPEEKSNISIQVMLVTKGNVHPTRPCSQVHLSTQPSFEREQGRPGGSYSSAKAGTVNRMGQNTTVEGNFQAKNGLCTVPEIKSTRGPVVQVKGTREGNG